MKIYTRTVIEWQFGNPVLTEHESHEYSGPIAKCEGITMSAILPSLIGTLAGGLVSTMKDDAPAPAPAAVIPEVEPPTTMPSPNSQESRAAKRKSIAQQMARRGRASTILTDSADAKLGG